MDKIMIKYCFYLATFVDDPLLLEDITRVLEAMILADKLGRSFFRDVMERMGIGPDAESEYLVWAA